MANDFSPSFKKVWAKDQQMQFYKINVARQIADTSFESELKRGDTFVRTYRSRNNIQKYVRGTAIKIDDKNDTAEELKVDQQFATGFYEDDFDAIQNSYDAASQYGKDDGVYLSNQIDADLLGEAPNAASTVDDGDLGGTAGNGIVVTASNVLSIFAAAKRKIRKQNVSPSMGLVAVVSPEIEEVLEILVAGKDTKKSDDVMEDGFVGKFLGFKTYSSNQALGTALLAMATNPTNGDTLVIQGVTITFVTVIGTTAGNVLIGANVDVTRASLAGLINAPTVTSATQVALSEENARLFINASATNDNAANTLLLKFKGVGVINVDSTLTAGADGWTDTQKKQHLVFGVKGGTAFIIQKEANPQAKDVPDKFGKNILNGQLYGYKTFSDGKKKMVDVVIDSSDFDV